VRPTSARDGGSTLAGLLVVIAVIGTLAVLIVLAVGAAQKPDTPTPKDGATSAACAAEYRTIQTAEETYHAVAGSYTSMSGLVSEHFLAAVSELYDVTPTGTSYSITGLPTSTSRCTAPPR